MKKKSEIKKLWGSGPLKIFDAELDAYVLEDGTPLLGKAKILKALGRPKTGAVSSNSTRPPFISAHNLTPFITEELEERLKGVDFKDGSKINNAYHADIIPLICNVYLEARAAGVLNPFPQQLAIAQRCEILMRAFARVGIVALVHEQLGFEKYKHPEALRMLIESYLAEEVRKWSKEFPDELFRQMDRIYGNEKTTSKNRPFYYAKFLRKYIYDPIEKGELVKVLDERNPRGERGFRKKKHHQHLNEETGLPALRSQIWQVVGVLKTSANKRAFENSYARLMGQSYQGSLFEE